MRKITIKETRVYPSTKRSRKHKKGHEREEAKFVNKYVSRAEAPQSSRMNTRKAKSPEKVENLCLQPPTECSISRLR
ncbi:unnamed protein product [Acanthoscelides obtectus]|uniref:Uncharacterized protein n=1 Tax=Acanthoscelides obtectus TaxID=200917 RepID=A0A9P0JX43_ACAOB|nr:unnamed protein product [Acanthoscelides obtectus]CAK1640689.1 hypothetical protein AOBTE_LOCUS11876 [Acanthoscelides obtectus]